MENGYVAILLMSFWFVICCKFEVFILVLKSYWACSFVSCNLWDDELSGFGDNVSLWWLLFP